MATKDRMQDVFPVVFDFKNGEQPSANKLTKWVKLEDIGFDRLTLAIGDPWDYQTHVKSGSLIYTLSPENLAQASLARIVGPSDFISSMGGSMEATPDPYVITLVANRNSWRLGFPLINRVSQIKPTSNTSVVATLTSSDLSFFLDAAGTTPETTNFITLKTVSTMEAIGDYAIDYMTGVIYTYVNPTTVVYLHINNLHMFGAGPQWATQNVIPTWADGTTVGVDITCTGPSSGGLYTYLLALPYIVNPPRTESSDKSYGTGVTAGVAIIPVEHPAPAGTTSRYRLPYSITSELSPMTGEILPEGYCFLWNNTARAIVALTEFEYYDEYTLYVRCPPLPDVDVVSPYETNNSNYRLIITGSSLAEQVGYLSSLVRDNTHVGLTEGGFQRRTLAYTPPISHDSLADRWSATTLTAGLGAVTLFSFRESSYPTNPHPQYLHRAGFLSSDLDGNSANAMRGYLIFSGQGDFKVAGGSTSTSGNWEETFGIQWGGGETSESSGNTTLSFKGGEGIDLWGAEDVACRWPMTMDYLGTSPVGSTYRHSGALTYTPWYGTPLYLRGLNQGGDFGGAFLAFDLGRNAEMNYIKLLAANRDATTVADPVNSPAYVEQTIFTTPLVITPGLSSRLSPDQVREFRFRGVPRMDSAVNATGSVAANFTGTVSSSTCSIHSFYAMSSSFYIGHRTPHFKIGDSVVITGATNAANNNTFTITDVSIGNDPYAPGVESTQVTVTGSTSIVDEHPTSASVAYTAREMDAYFVSPSMIGADFLNVYSNAIFFSQEGDGQKTSFHDVGGDWMNYYPTQPPVGLYYTPAIEATGSSFGFVTRDTDTTTPSVPLVFGGTYGFTVNVHNAISLTTAHNFSATSTGTMSFLPTAAFSVSASNDIGLTINGTGSHSLTLQNIGAGQSNDVTIEAGRYHGLLYDGTAGDLLIAAHSLEGGSTKTLQLIVSEEDNIGSHSTQKALFKLDSTGEAVLETHYGEIFLESKSTNWVIIGQEVIDSGWTTEEVAVHANRIMLSYSVGDGGNENNGIHLENSSGSEICVVLHGLPPEDPGTPAYRLGLVSDGGSRYRLVWY